MPDLVEQSDESLLRPLKHEREAATTAELKELEMLSQAAIVRRLPELRAETLVALIRWWDARGDAAAVESATDALMIKVDGWLNRRLKSVVVHLTEREDVRGEIVLEVLTGVLSRADGDGFWECRFFVCLFRCWLDIVKPRRRHQMQESDFTTADGTDTTDWTPDTSVLTPEMAALQHDALAHLPDKERDAFVRTHLGGETQEEIAAQMGITDRTVRNLLKRADNILAAWRVESENTP